MSRPANEANDDGLPMASRATAAAPPPLAPAFVPWQESEVHNHDDHGEGDGKGDGDDDEASGPDDAMLRLFGAMQHGGGDDDDENVYEEVRYEYETETEAITTKTDATAVAAAANANNKVVVTIRHHADYPESTGLAVWRGSEILARFLVDQQRQQQTATTTTDAEPSVTDPVVVPDLRDLRVLEVGAGAGLPGIVAHAVLGARRVLVTDGDSDALRNLRGNVERNQRTDDTNRSIACVQLIWGRSVPAFVETHGQQDVVLLADCVYMKPSLEPLWDTVDALLTETGTVVYCQTAASAVPWELFAGAVASHGFETAHKVVGRDLARYDVDNEPPETCDGDEAGEEYEQGIYVFRRKQQKPEER